MTRAVGYTRLSQESDTSITQQKREIREYCNEHGFELARIYDDGEMSSGFTADRSEYQAMLTEIEAGDVDAVVVRNADRISRDKKERALFFLQATEDTAVHSTELDGEIDVDDDEGYLLEMLRGYMDDVSKRKEIERARREIQRRLDKGYDQGRPPLGFEFDADGKYWVPGDDFDTAVRVLQLRDDGKSYAAIEDSTGVPKTTAYRVVERREKYVAELANPARSPSGSL